MRAGRLLLIGVAFVGMVSTSPGLVGACSMAASPGVEEVVSGEPLLGGTDANVAFGVYEYEHIARSSGLFGDRSVTVITRYWGEPPADLGTKVVVTGCGSWARDSGSVGYWWIDPFHTERFPDWRSSLTLEGTVAGLDARQSASLTARFGDPVEVGVSPVTRSWAFALAWQRELLLVSGVAASIWLIARRRSTVSADSMPIAAD